MYLNLHVEGIRAPPNECLHEHVSDLQRPQWPCACGVYEKRLWLTAMKQQCASCRQNIALIAMLAGCDAYTNAAHVTLMDLVCEFDAFVHNCAM